MSVDVPIAAQSASHPLVTQNVEREVEREVGHLAHIPFGRVPIPRRGETLESMSCKCGLINRILSFLRRAFWYLGYSIAVKNNHSGIRSNNITYVVQLNTYAEYHQFQSSDHNGD